jgi:hypothetical protein
LEVNDEMSTSSNDVADTLGSLERLRARTIADAYRWSWLLWLFWAAVYVGSVAVFLAAPDWAIGLYWLCVIPIAVGATVAVARRLPARGGVVPVRGRELLVGSVAVAAVALAIAPFSPLAWPLAVSFGIVAFGWIWPRRLAIAIAAGLAAAAGIVALLLDERDALATTTCVYAAAFVAYGFFERARLRALR